MDKQVFQTDSTSRWNKFKWTLRIVLFIVALFVAVFVTMLIIDRIPSFPFKEDFRSAVAANKPYLKQNKFSREYKGFGISSVRKGT